MASLLAGHGIMAAGIAWFVARRHYGRQRESDNYSHVLRNPHGYDRLVSLVTLGREKKLHNRILNLANIQANDRVLDVGCGTGALLMEATNRLGTAISCHGVDRSAEMLAYAREKAAALGISATFGEASADSLPFPDASFDVVFNTLMLHHLPVSMQTAAVLEMARVLRRGGRIVIVDMERPGKIPPVLSIVGMLHFFHPAHAVSTAPDWKELAKLLEQNGVQIIRQCPVWGRSVQSLSGCIPPSMGSATLK